MLFNAYKRYGEYEQYEKFKRTKGISKASLALIFITFLCLLFIFLNSSQAYAAAAADTKTIEAKLKEEERRLDRIKSQLDYHKKRTSGVVIQEKGVVKQLEGITRKMAITEQQMTVINLKRDKLTRSIKELNEGIKNTSFRIEEVKALLKERFITIYKYGGVAEFNLLLSAARADEAMANAYLLSKIADQDQALIKELADKKVRLNNAHKEATKQRQLLEDQNQQLKGQQKVLKTDTDQRNVLLGRLRKEKGVHEEAQRQLAQDERELQNTINRLIEQKRKAIAAARAAAAAKNKTLAPEPVYYTGGKIRWPHVGQIMSPFGTRTHPIFKTKLTHTGLDIDGNTGDPVYAAADGEVLYANWLRGFGQVVILDHGKNMTTVYAHLSKIMVNEGKVLKAGEQLGKVGSTGVATGSHLHFEVRINGKSVNPMGYLN